MSKETTRQLVNRLSRIEGHVRAIEKMIDADRPCTEVLMQIVAVRSALNKVAQIILDGYVEQHLQKVSQGNDFESELIKIRDSLNLMI